MFWLKEGQEKGNGTGEEEAGAESQKAKGLREAEFGLQPKSKSSSSGIKLGQILSTSDDRKKKKENRI